MNDDIINFQNIINKIIRQFNLSFDEKRSLLESCDTFANMISNQDLPQHYFDFIGHGSYKNCFYLDDLCNFVIKFCSIDNYTFDERNTIYQAKQMNMDQIFVPSYYCQLNTIIDIYDTDYLDLLENSFDSYVIQPVAQILEDNYYILNNFKNTISDDFIRLYFPDLYDAGYDHVSWIKSVIIQYGFAFAVKLNDFVKNFYIDDLYERNLGFYQGKPIIVDWTNCKF